MTSSNWKRVSRSRPCPICSKPDWCLIREDGTAAICARIESSNRRGEAGWLHRLGDGSGERFHPRRGVRLDLGHDESTDFEREAIGYRDLIEVDRLERFASKLGLKAETLHRFGVGWSPGYSAWAFPMRDGFGRTIGVQLRKPDGGKLCVKGSKLGLFVPADLDAVETLFVAEGMTDAAALTELGFVAVGRPSCSSGERHLVEMVRRLSVQHVVVVGDGDEPGQKGARSLASALVAYLPGGVRVIYPPEGIKDIRGWYCAGCSRGDVLALVDSAPVRRLRVVLKTRGG